MDGLYKSLTQNTPLYLIVLTVVIIALIGWVGLTASRFGQVTKRFKDLLSGSEQNDLESLLIEHTRERIKMREEIIALEARVAALEGKMNKAKRHLGLVKYDAFDDVGGQQSFALAIYDDRGDGAIVSSIVGRADCRVYAKPIMGGKSERSLSNEEQQAIMDAASLSPKGFVSK